MNWSRIVTSLLVSATTLQLNAQRISSDDIRFFVPDSSNAYLDLPQVSEWEMQYPDLNEFDTIGTKIPYLSVEPGRKFVIAVDIHAVPIELRKQLKWEMCCGGILRTTARVSMDTLVFEGLPTGDHFRISVLQKDTEITAIEGRAYKRHTEYLTIVPLVDTDIHLDSVKHYLDDRFRCTGIQFQVDLLPKMSTDSEFQSTWRNPSPDYDRYTMEMTTIRDQFFSGKSRKKKGYFMFIIDGFTNPDIAGYIVRNKGIGFIKKDAEYPYRSLARNLAIGLGGLEETWRSEGPLKGTTNNLLDTGDGDHLTHDQWTQINRYCHVHSYYDDYEDVRASGGMVAYYFWEESENGEIKSVESGFLSAIRRGIKRNQFTYFQQIDFFLFEPIFTVAWYDINSLHLLTELLLIVLFFIFRARLKRRVAKRSFIIQWPIQLGFVLFSLSVMVATFFWINSGYSLFEVKQGEIKEFEGKSMQRTVHAVKYNHNSPVVCEDAPKSQVLIRKHGKWELKRQKNVLYFDYFEKSGKFRFSHDSNRLPVSGKSLEKYPKGHYFVVRTKDSSGKPVKETVYNHAGTDVTAKMNLPDPAKRILLFVNGYRPTSSGKAFSESLGEISEKGLEFPNSHNLIFDFDRYGYWNPWQQIDERFEERINPTETLYADGHFSVETSNHRNLVHFTSLTARYPKRCTGKHVCAKREVEGLFGTKSIETMKMFDLRPNRRGFKKRWENGRIAGKNLLQILGEVPNDTKNDTLFIVAHSMGYAYALGIIDELRGKIQFGDFVIMAPENASAGSVNTGEWMNVWQYGSDFSAQKLKMPCLTDGVAPQTAAGGLTAAHRIFIPKDVRQGFFDSHFVGYYTWIFDIPKGQKGHILQR